MSKTCTVIGAGLTGATAAHLLMSHGWNVQIVDSLDEVGGNCRTGFLKSVRYERCGPHIFHTSDAQVADFVRRWLRPYTHRVQSVTGIGTLSWPPQVSELKKLPLWKKIAQELDDLPGTLPDPRHATFEDYAVALMGPILYRAFIEGYTFKQWGVHPREMSAVFAPKRIDLRDDDYLPLFRDPFQGWLNVPHMIDYLLSPRCSITLGQPMTEREIAKDEHCIVTAPLDVFLHGKQELSWRGIDFMHVYQPGNDLLNPVAVINHPKLGTRFTRETEHRHMTGEPGAGTVISYEFPRSGVETYPVNDAEGKNRGMQLALEAELHEILPKAVPAGRLARYVYIDMDQAVRMGWNAAEKVMATEG